MAYATRSARSSPLARSSSPNPPNCRAARGSPFALPDTSSAPRQPMSNGPAGVSSSPAISAAIPTPRSEEHTPELLSLMRISYAVSCMKKQNDSYDDKQIYLQSLVIHLINT